MSTEANLATTNSRRDLMQGAERVLRSNADFLTMTC
jgi:hypothetical protein